MQSAATDLREPATPRSRFVTTIAWLGIVAGVLTLLAGALMAYAFDLLLAGPDLDADLAKLASDPHVPAVLGWVVLHPSAVFLATIAFGVAVVVVSVAMLRRHKWGRTGVLGVLWLGILVNVAGAALTVISVRAVPVGLAELFAEMGGDFERISWGVIATAIGGAMVVVALHVWVMLGLRDADEFD